MADVLSYLLVCLAIISCCLGVNIVKTDWKREIGKFMSITFFSSAVWSFCIGIMINLESQYWAWVWRSVGIIGTYIFMIGVVWIVIAWNDMHGVQKRLFRIIPVLFVLVLPLNLHRDAVTFTLTGYGMAYAFVPGFAANVYTYYYVIEVIEIVFLISRMRFYANSVYKKKLVNKLFIGTAVTGVGMIFDTFMPMVGLSSFPGSTLTQAISVFVFYGAYWYERNNSVDITNFSRFVYDLMQEPILIYDKYLKLKIINNSGMKFFGIPEDCKGSYPLEELFEVPNDWYVIRKDGVRLEAKCKVNDTSCGLAIDKIGDVYGECIGYIVVVNDMTQKIWAMKEMEQAKIQAERANKAKSTFLANMSHEIRTPINAVLGMDEMILRESKRPEIIDYARQIRSASKSLLSIINEILDFSKIESGKMELAKNTYESLDLCKEIVRVSAFRAKDKKIKVKLDLDENFPQRLYGDEMRVKQIINNLMTNAVKYTEEGTVTLKVSCDYTGDVCAESGKKKIIMKVSVIDTGRGITKEQMSKLFESFQRLDENAVHNIEGTGLGLSIVKGLLDLMEGTIEVESEPGKGSEFKCFIPQEIASEKTVGVAEGKKTPKDNSKFTKEQFTAPDAIVLVVDDNRVNLTVVRGLLKRTKVQVEVATGGAEAIEKASKKAYHMIFMDHMMPEIDGVEALRRLKAMEDNASRDAAVIALTANAMIGMREQYLEAGFDDYLSKPIDTDKLEKMMIEYLPNELVNKS